MKTETKSRKAKTNLIDSDVKSGAYDMRVGCILIDHPELGRILITEGFGGMGQLCGGAYRWRHGIALSVASDATLSTLGQKESESGPLSESHSIIEWDGAVLDKIARSHGK